MGSNSYFVEKIQGLGFTQTAFTVFFLVTDPVRDIRRKRDAVSRFQIGRVIVVADRGIVSEENLELLSEDSEFPFDSIVYIVGCRMRKQKGVTE